MCKIKKLGIKSPLSAVSEVPGKSFRRDHNFLNFREKDKLVQLIQRSGESNYRYIQEEQ